MDREKLFEAFLSECKRRGEICGQGNPNSNILIIGQEPFYENDTYEKDEGKRIDYIKKNYDDCCDPARRINIPARKGISTTWKNYQKLIDIIYPDKPKEYSIIDFEKYAYTTELNKVPRKNRKLDKTTIDNINSRLIFFEKSEFIQSFPVIILACSGYIINQNDNRQIDKTFHVSFENGRRYDCPDSSGNWFCTHYDKKNPDRLVIHTRQFSMYMRNDLIKEMASEINNHLTKRRLI